MLQIHSTHLGSNFLLNLYSKCFHQQLIVLIISNNHKLFYMLPDLWLYFLSCMKFSLFFPSSISVLRLNWYTIFTDIICYTIIRKQCLADIRPKIGSIYLPPHVLQLLGQFVIIQSTESPVVQYPSSAQPEQLLSLSLQLPPVPSPLAASNRFCT